MVLRQPRVIYAPAVNQMRRELDMVANSSTKRSSRDRHQRCETCNGGIHLAVSISARQLVSAALHQGYKDQICRPNCSTTLKRGQEIRMRPRKYPKFIIENQPLRKVAETRPQRKAILLFVQGFTDSSNQFHVFGLCLIEGVRALHTLEFWIEQSHQLDRNI